MQNQCEASFKIFDNVPEKNSFRRVKWTKEQENFLCYIKSHIEKYTLHIASKSKEFDLEKKR